MPPRFFLFRKLFVSLMLALGSEQFNIDRKLQVVAEKPPQSVAFEELLKVVMWAVEKLGVEWPMEEESIVCFKLDDCFLTHHLPY